MEGTSTLDVINGDVFFEIIDPAELEYTYRIRPAKDFGAPFVCTISMFVCYFFFNNSFNLQNASFHIKNVPLVPVLPKNGCKPPDNLDDVEGSVAFIERGYVIKLCVMKLFVSVQQYYFICVSFGNY